MHLEPLLPECPALERKLLTGQEFLTAFDATKFRLELLRSRMKHGENLLSGSLHPEPCGKNFVVRGWWTNTRLVFEWKSNETAKSVEVYDQSLRPYRWML
jgi:hypothetical protein